MAQIAKKKRGVKRREDIRGVYLGGDALEMFFLEMLAGGDMGVDPKTGLATLERFITERKIFVTENGESLSSNTTKGDFTEILRESLREITNNKKKK